MAKVKSNISVSKMVDEVEKGMTEEEGKKYSPTVTNRQHISAEKLKQFMPRGSSVQVTDAILDMLNRVEEDTGVDQGLFEEQLLSYMHLVDNGVGLEKLANAIKFCNLRMLPKMSNTKAYKIVFPDKAKEIEDRDQSCDSFASMYNSSKLVTEISKLLMVPVYITNAPVHLAMHKKLFDLSNGIGAREGDYVSPTVQMNAAIALMEATKMPEDKSIELKIGMSDEAKSVQLALTEQLSRLAASQVAQFKAGVALDKVQRIGVNVVDVEVVEGSDES